MRSKVAIIHPWYPQYRREVFSKLVEIGSDRGIDIDIYYGDPPPEWGERGDSVSDGSATHLTTRFFRFGSKSVALKSLRALKRRGPYRLILLEQAVRNVETYRLVLGNTPVAFWGHGKTYTLAVSAPQERLKQWLTHRGVWFFAYTNGGAEAVEASGYDRANITVVENSIDTAGLAREMGAVSAGRIAAVSSEYDLRGATALFMGGLDESKRLGFLLDASDVAAAVLPDFRLLIAGNGSQRDFVARAAARRPWITLLPTIVGRQKAEIMSASQIIAMPGRVGLIAVDSFVSGLPIVTTAWSNHAPEFEYLSPGIDSVVSVDSVDSYGAALAEVLSNSRELERLGANAAMLRTRYSTDNMAAKLVDGIEMALRRVGIHG